MELVYDITYVRTYVGYEYEMGCCINTMVLDLAAKGREPYPPLTTDGDWKGAREAAMLRAFRIQRSSRSLPAQYKDAQ